MNGRLLKACHDVWRLGYKREKALAYCANELGYKPLEQDYVEHFRFMINNALELKQ